MSDESDERKTEPSVAIPPEQEAHARAAAYGRALLAYQALGCELGVGLKDYVEGTLSGQVAEAANIAGTRIAVTMRAKQDAFEAHIRDELTEIRKQNESILSLMRTFTDERLKDRQRIVSLEDWKVRHERGNEHCQSCPYHDKHESQIGAVGGE